MKSEWRPVEGYEGLYEVSASGLVRSLPRYTTSGRILRPRANRHGYQAVQLSREGVVTNQMVHRLVAEAFLGPCPDGHECAHHDGDRSNNQASNLKWKTRSDNHFDKHRHGTALIGPRNHSFKYPDSTIRKIRELRIAGVALADISRRLKVPYTYVHAISTGRKRRYVVQGANAPNGQEYHQ